MENSSKIFRDALALQIKESKKERDNQLEQAKSSNFSDKLKELMKLEIMENFNKQINEIRESKGYKEAKQIHLNVIRAKTDLKKANIEREKLLQEYMEKLKKADENITQYKKIYEEAEIKYGGENQNHNIDTGEVINNDYHIEKKDSYDNKTLDDKIISTQGTETHNKNTNQNEDVENNDKKDDYENRSNSGESQHNEDYNSFEIKSELVGNEEAIKKDLKKHVTIETCMDKTGYSGKKITINIPKIGNKFPGYKFECFVSDEKFKNANKIKSAHGRFISRDDMFGILESINSYMNIYGITRDKYGYNRYMLCEIDNCVGMECFKYITGLDSFYWLEWDFKEYKLNCTGKNHIFTDKNKRAHLLLTP